MNRSHRLVLTVIATGLVVLTLFAAGRWMSYDRERDRLLDFSRHIGEIQRLGDAATMAARLAVLSGEPEHAAKFAAFDLPLRSRIASAETIAGTQPNLLSRVRSLKAEAGSIERQAIARLAAGDTDVARALIADPEYRALKQQERQLVRIADALLTAQLNEAADRSRMILAGLVSLIAAIGAALGTLLLYFGRIRAREERQRAQVETLNSVMATVMDSQNNFLNNMVYFRTKAESGARMDDAELRQIDEAIQDVRHRMREIAETEDFSTRDLGGIHVLRPARRDRKPRRLAG